MVITISNFMSSFFVLRKCLKTFTQLTDIVFMWCCEIQVSSSKVQTELARSLTEDFIFNKNKSVFVFLPNCICCEIKFLYIKQKEPTQKNL